MRQRLLRARRTWSVSQESEVTNDERTSARFGLAFHAALSGAQARSNFIRAQAASQLALSGEGALARLDFDELVECIVRCAIDTYSQLLRTHLPSHGRHAMTMAEAVRAWLSNLL